MSGLGHSPVNQQVLQYILDLLLSERLVPGSRLDEQGLAKEMGVSRTPLREAIARLAEKGLIEYRPYQGNFVRIFSPDEIRGIYEVRRSLEELAIRLAVSNMTPELLQEIRAVLDVLASAMDRGDITAVNLADRQFHSLIAHASGNSTLISILDELDLQIELIRSMANQNPEVVLHTSLQRPQILSALETGDADTAARLLGEHIGYVCESVLAAPHFIGQQDRAHSTSPVAARTSPRTTD